MSAEVQACGPWKNNAQLIRDGVVPLGYLGFMADVRKMIDLICPNCGASASLPLGMVCIDHRPAPISELEEEEWVVGRSQAILAESSLVVGEWVH